MSKTISLYGLSQEFKGLEQLSQELECDEVTGEIIDNSKELKELFEGLEIDLIDKLDNSNYIKKELEGKATLLGNEIKRLQQRKKAYENRADRLKELMYETILVSGETKLKGKHSFSLSVRKSLKIDENLTADFFNQKYIRVKKEFDKKKITDDLKSGATIEGAEMVEKLNLIIR